MFKRVSTRIFQDELLSRGFSVWLIGSHANPTERQPADWDFMIFGTKALLDELTSQQPIPDVDAFVVFDGDNFKNPWPRASDGAIKKGSLKEWKWKSISEERASYEGTKWPDDWGSPKYAIRLNREAIIPNQQFIHSVENVQD